MHRAVRPPDRRCCNAAAALAASVRSTAVVPHFDDVMLNSLGVIIYMPAAQIIERFGGSAQLKGRITCVNPDGQRRN
jgi:hypothetical protein